MLSDILKCQKQKLGIIIFFKYAEDRINLERNIQYKLGRYVISVKEFGQLSINNVKWFLRKYIDI